MSDLKSKVDSANADNGKATITSFRYYKGYCIVTLDNGITGIIGDTQTMSLTTMLSLKGQQIEYQYNGVDNGNHKRYYLGFALL